MAENEGQQNGGREQLDEFPAVELDWAHDDRRNPSTLTIFDPETPRIASSWITVNTSSSISLDEIR